MGEKRIGWMDNARALAILCVVLTHSVESNYYYVLTGSLDACFSSWLFQTVAYFIGRLGVPFFLMLSGALLLGKKHEPMKFYRRSLLPLLLTSEIWILVYSILSHVMFGDYLDLEFLIRQMLMMERTSFNHVWYLYMILGVYLCVPFLSAAVSGFSLKQLMPVLVTAFLAFFVFPLWNLFPEQVFPDAYYIYPWYDVSFLGGTYGLYLLAGYAVAHFNTSLRKLPSVAAALLAVLFCGLCVGLEYYFHTWNLSGADGILWYSSPLIFLCALLLFELLRRITKSCKALMWLSKVSFSVYLLHNIFLQLFNLFCAETPWFYACNIVLKTLLRFCVSLGGSLLVCGLFCLLPLPRLKKVSLYLR